MQDIARATKSELRKVLSLRSSLVYAILLIGSISGPIVLVGLFGDKAELDWASLITAVVLFQMITIIFAAASTSAQYASHMHAHAFLANKRRSSWLIGRGIVVAGYVLVTFLIGVAFAYIAAKVLPNAELIDSSMAPVWLSMIGVVLLAVLAVGIAGIVRNRVLAVGLPLVWLLVLEGLIAMGAMQVKALEGLPNWLPGGALLGLTTGIDGGHNVLVLVLWAAVLCVGGIAVNQRRDIN